VITRHADVPLGYAVLLALLDGFLRNLALGELGFRSNPWCRALMEASVGCRLAVAICVAAAQAHVVVRHAVGDAGSVVRRLNCVDDLTLGWLGGICVEAVQLAMVGVVGTLLWTSSLQANEGRVDAAAHA
jgi:hypothetical protein